MGVEIWLLNLGAFGLILTIVMRRISKAKRRPAPRWLGMVSMWSIMAWGLGLVLLLIHKFR